MRKWLAAFCLAGLSGAAWGQFCPGPSGGFFEDVDASDPFCGVVTWLAQNNITLGCAPGAVDPVNNRLFCPASSVTSTQVAAFLKRLGDLEQDRVAGTCPAGQAVRSVNADGSVVCGAFEVAGRIVGTRGHRTLPFRNEIALLAVREVEVVGACLITGQARVFARIASGEVADVFSTSQSTGFGYGRVIGPNEHRFGLTAGPFGTDRGNFNVATGTEQVDGSFSQTVDDTICSFTASALSLL